MKIFSEHNTPISYEQHNIQKKQNPQDSKNQINQDKDYIRHMEVGVLLTLEEKSSYRNKYFEELDKSTRNGISGAMDKYESIYNEITKNTSEGVNRDLLIDSLDQALEFSGMLYSIRMSGQITSLSKVKLATEPIVKGRNQMNKPDISEFKSMIKKDKEIQYEIKNMFVNVKNYFKSNGSFSGISDSIFTGGSSTFTMNDLNGLSNGLMKELTKLSDSGASHEEISKKVNQSDLSDYMKQLIIDVAQKNFKV